jgi:polyhydroxyalkanoate synthase
VGKNIASTPGKVVYRNRLFELIQYAPQTATVHSVPLLCSPPFINKYYIMDLAPGRSFVEWAVKNGHTTFCMSYRNPDESLRDVGLGDYLLEGPLEALRVVKEITGSRRSTSLRSAWAAPWPRCSPRTSRPAATDRSTR